MFFALKYPQTKKYFFPAALWKLHPEEDSQATEELQIPTSPGAGKREVPFIHWLFHASPGIFTQKIS